MLLIDTSVWIDVFRDRKGLTVRSPIDCCIAQAALENNLLLIHNDRDFETIAQVRLLQHLCFQT
jgi:hypothetical protein